MTATTTETAEQTTPVDNDMTLHDGILEEILRTKRIHRGDARRSLLAACGMLIFYVVVVRQFSPHSNEEVALFS